MNNFNIGLYEKAMPPALSWPQKLSAAKEAGYDFLELSVDETEEKLPRLKMSRNERFALIKAMFDEGLPMRTMCLSGHRKYPLGSENYSTRKKSFEIMEDAIELSYDLGIRIIQLAGYDVYYEKSNEKTRGLFLDGLGKSVRMAEKRGVILAFETMETEFMNTVEKALFYVKKINSPYLAVYPDCGSITNAVNGDTASVIKDLKAGAGHIAALHLKETSPGVFRDLFFGEGYVDFEAIIKTARKINVSIMVTEFWWKGQEDWYSIIKNARIFFE